MATKKKATKKKTTSRRRRSPVAKRATRRRSTVTKMSVGIKPMDLVLGVGGMLAVEFAADNAAISKVLKDPRIRYGAIAAVAAYGAYKAPREFKPFLVGAALGAGMKAAVAVFPKLLPSARGGSAKSTPIGRLTEGEQESVRRAVEYRMEQGGDGVWTLNGGASPVTGRGFASPVTGPRPGQWRRSARQGFMNR